MPNSTLLATTIYDAFRSEGERYLHRIKSDMMREGQTQPPHSVSLNHSVSAASVSSDGSVPRPGTHRPLAPRGFSDGGASPNVSSYRRARPMLGAASAGGFGTSSRTVDSGGLPTPVGSDQVARCCGDVLTSHRLPHAPNRPHATPPFTHVQPNCIAFLLLRAATCEAGYDIRGRRKRRERTCVQHVCLVHLGFPSPARGIQRFRVAVLPKCPFAQVRSWYFSAQWCCQRPGPIE
jgi:hypothetical protein